MRVKSKWFKADRGKSPREIAGAMAFILWRIGQNFLKNMRKAEFEVAAGPQYFAYLSELLVFLIQISDRIAYARLSNPERTEFTTELVIRLSEIMAENQDRLLDDISGKKNFIALFNFRSDNYAEIDYAEGGFLFTRCLANLLLDIANESDKRWIVDQVMTTEAPEAISTVEKAMKNLLSND